MQCVLRHADLWCVTNKKMLRPAVAAGAAEVENWDKLNEKALTTIMLSVKPSQLNYLKNCQTAADAWDKLVEVYKPSGPLRKASLYKKLLALRMSDTATMTQYINSFIDFSEKLSEVGISLGDELLVIISLSSLPKDFENFVIAMETRDELPKFDILKVKLLEEWERRNQQNEKEETVTIQQAFALKSNQQPNNKNSNNFKCYRCGKRGHYAKNCRTKQKEKNNQQQKQHSFALLAAYKNNDFSKSSWCIDSGATAHICCDRQKFISFVECKEKIMLASDQFIEAEGKGDVQINIHKGSLILKDVLFVPSMIGNFIAVSRATNNGLRVKFEKENATITNNSGIVLLKANICSNLFIFTEEIPMNYCLKTNSAVLWHNRYGHINFKTLNDICNNKSVDGLMLDNIPKDVSCTTCMQSKICSQPFSASKSRSNKMLELVHTDVCGPMNTQSVGGARYFVLFIDEMSRWISVYFIKHKSEVIEKFKIFKSFVENQTDCKIKAIRSDNGTEYVNKTFDNYSTTAICTVFATTKRRCRTGESDNH